MSVKLQNSSEAKIKYWANTSNYTYNEIKSFDAGFNIEFAILVASDSLTAYPWTGDNGVTKYQYVKYNKYGPSLCSVTSGTRTSGMAYSFEIAYLNGSNIRAIGPYFNSASCSILCMGIK